MSEVRDLTDSIRNSLKPLLLRARKIAEGYKNVALTGMQDIDEAERALNEFRSALGELRGELGSTTNGPPG